MSPTDRRRRIAPIVTKVFAFSGLRAEQQAVINAAIQTIERHRRSLVPGTFGVWRLASAEWSRRTTESQSTS